jgi:hypothetical protein
LSVVDALSLYYNTASSLRLGQLIIGIDISNSEKQRLRKLFLIAIMICGGLLMLASQMSNPVPNVFSEFTDWVSVSIFSTTDPSQKYSTLEKKIYQDLQKLSQNQMLPREFFLQSNVWIEGQSLFSDPSSSSAAHLPLTTQSTTKENPINKKKLKTVSTNCASVSTDVFRHTFQMNPQSRTKMTITLISVPEDQTKIMNANPNPNLTQGKVAQASDSCLVSYEIFDLKTDNKLFEFNRHYHP